ncbi:MAG: hypothetical protein KDA17_00520 [Candidatus Saccharibacteria bacterium]|nr:hypothetical protein [Candidatus Saccharibacteria bacterium]
MPKVSPLQSSFGAGEFSPLLHGQVELDRYKQALDTCQNYIPSLQGGLVRRSGTMYVADTETVSEASRLVPFQFSTTQAYILEFGNLYMRVYRNNAQVTSGGVPYEIVTPYAAADLFQLRFTQSADTLGICHPDYPPYFLSRTGHTAWTLTEFLTEDGPYLPINATTMTLTPSAATGAGVTVSTGPATAITATADSGGLIKITSTAHGKVTGDKVGISGVGGTTEANGSWTITKVDADNFTLDGSTYANAWTAGGDVYPYLFESTDVGRLIRMQEGSVWGWGSIATFVNYGQVTFDVESTLTDTTSKTFWRLGVYSETTGYPACVTFHEDRLCFAGATNYPQRIDCSRVADYPDFAPSATDGTVTDSHALSFTFNANDVNVVRWIISDEKGLLVGTSGGEWIARPSSQGEALTPSNITAKRSTTYGSANVQAVKFGKSVLFLQKSARKIRELMYFYDADGFSATDMTLLAEHITTNGVTEMVVQKEPQPILWCVRGDGQLIGLTYERDVDSFKVGWHRHIVGGVSDAGGTAAKVESVAVIPSADGTRDELWMIVQRYVNGAVTRHVEYMTKLFDDSVEQKDAFFLDAGLTYDAPVTITGITRANPGVVTAVAHGFSNGDKVLISDVLGMTEVNGNSYLVANKTTDTFELTSVAGVNTNTSAFTVYVSGGEVRKYVSTISGLTHLEGETVDILADGAVQPSATVASGAITLSVAATTVHVGYGYESDARMLRLNAGSADGTSIGKTQRTHRVGVMLHRSLGLKLGMGFDDLTTITFRTSADAMTRAPALFTGILSENVDGGYDFQNQLCIRQDQPLPSMILALMPQLHTQDR